MTYEMDIAGLKRELPICKVTDDLYIGAFVMFGDVELTVHCATELLKRAPEYDYLIAPEAKAIPLLYEMARQSGAEKYFLARKTAKAYMSGVFEVNVKSITTAAVQRLIIDSADAEQIRGKRMLILDDVISTGESLRAMEELVTAAGGIVAGRMGGRYRRRPHGRPRRGRRHQPRRHHRSRAAAAVQPRRHREGIIVFRFEIIVFRKPPPGNRRRFFKKILMVCVLGT